MYTRCPACHSVHAVSAALLAAASGRYRCAHCHKVSNALEHLFDELPAAGDRPPGPAGVPVLGMPLDLGGTERSGPEPDGGEEPGDDTRRSGGRQPGRLLLRAAWIAGAVVVLGFIAIRVAEFQGWPLPPFVDPGRTVPSAGQEWRGFRDPDQVHLVSREMRSHPSQPGTLRLAATIVNRAAQKQEYPVIEVSLQDAGGRTLSTRRFEPAEYVGGTRSAAGMTPGAYVPILLELEDPGARAVGFELAFR